jgi:hypothetical protein
MNIKEKGQGLVEYGIVALILALIAAGYSFAEIIVLLGRYLFCIAGFTDFCF